jgi:hypothetical protein
MSPVISSIYYLAIDLPGTIWRAVKNFFENSLGKWWYSHYR